MKLPQIYALIVLLFCLACNASKSDAVDSTSTQKQSASSSTSKNATGSSAKPKAAKPQKAKVSSLDKLTDRQKTAMSLVEAKDFDTANEQIDQLLARDKSAANYFLKGRLHIEKKEGAEAVAIFKKAVEIAPKDASILAGYAWALMSNYKYDDAINQANLAHNIDRENDLVNAIKGYYFLGTQKYQEAEYNLNKAITANPDVGHYYYARARVFNALKNKDKACEDMRSAKEKGYGIPQSQIDSFCASAPPREPVDKSKKEPYKIPFGPKKTD